jgi:hypothetical protein
VESDVTELREPLKELAGNLGEIQELTVSIPEHPVLSIPCLTQGWAFVPLAQTSVGSLLRDKLRLRAALRRKEDNLTRRIRFFRTLGDVETLLGLAAAEEGGRAAPGLSAGALAPVKGLLDSPDPAHVVDHCAKLDRAGQGWLSLTADLS